MRFLFPKYKYKDSIFNEDDIMKEIKDSLFYKKVEEEFNINLKSNDKIFSLIKINNNNKKFNFHVEDIKNKERIIGFGNQNMINKDNNIDVNSNKKINKDNNLNEEPENIKLNKDDKNTKTNIVLTNSIKNDYINNICKNDRVIIINKNLNNEPNINKNNSNFNQNNNPNIFNIINNNNIQYNFKQNELYYFPIIGLNNVGSTCFMNAILQCLIHIPELSLYFLNEYPNDKEILNSKNASLVTKGRLSNAFYEIVKNIDDLYKSEVRHSYNSYSPKKFKEILGTYNPQFRKYEANDSKDLILYLLQTFHEELNYFGDKAALNIQQTNQTSRKNTYNIFNLNYNSTNFSKISQLFYGTYENYIICKECNSKYYSFQKFEYISFSTYNYQKNNFDIMNGFEDIESKQKLEGENKYFCNQCKKLVNAEIYYKIFELAKYLILNIDYGKDKKFDINKLIFEHKIDLKKFLSNYYGQRTEYKLVSICTHKGSSGSSGHYIAFCLDKINDQWYQFNDSSCKKCDKYELKRNSPYILIYELT